MRKNFLKLGALSLLSVCLLTNTSTVHANEKKIYVNNSPIIDDKSVIKEEASKEVVNVISELVNAENNHEWEKFSSLWCQESKDYFLSCIRDEEYMKKKKGVFCVESARVVYLEKVTETAEIEFKDYLKYDDLEVYLVGIDYTVSEVSEDFFNGVNYRYIYIGKENGQYKVVGRTEASVEELEELNSDYIDGKIIWESKDYSDDDARIAYQIRMDRINDGVVEDSIDVKKIENSGGEGVKADNMNCYTTENYLSDNYWNKFSKTVLYNNQSSRLSGSNGVYSDTNKEIVKLKSAYRKNHTAKTKCSCKDRSNINIRYYIYNSDTKRWEDQKKTINVNMDTYLKVVLNSEMVLSTYGKEALKAQMVAIHEFAYWNQVYYRKYVDMDYDLKGNSTDQAYDKVKWNNTSKKWKDYAKDIYSEVGKIHMHTEKYSSAFESGYVRDESYDVDDYGTMYQLGAKKYAQEGRDYETILRIYYSNQPQMGLSGKDVGTISFKNFE